MVISSAEPGDGKTTVMANLAVSYVQSGKKTLLIDADLRRPGLTNLMGMKGQAGLTDLSFRRQCRARAGQPTGAAYRLGGL